MGFTSYENYGTINGSFGGQIRAFYEEAEFTNLAFTTSSTYSALYGEGDRTGWFNVGYGSFTPDVTYYASGGVELTPSSGLSMIGTYINQPDNAGITGIGGYYAGNGTRCFYIGAIGAGTITPSLYGYNFTPSSENATDIIGILSFAGAVGETPPSKATNPTPSDEDTRVDFSGLVLDWDDGGGADTFDVYIGPVGSLVKVADAIAPSTYTVDTGDVPWGETIYWRVDSTNDNGTTTGDTWSFDVVIIRSVWLGSAGSFLVVAAKDGVYLSADSGTNWTRKTPDSTEDTDWIKGICSSDGSYIIVESSAHAIYRSANSGTSWAEITPAGGDTYAVSKMATSDDGQYMVMVGTNSTDATESCYLSTNYGVDWTAIKPVAASIAWTDCDINNDGTIIGVSTTSYLYFSFDSGSTWTIQNLTPSAEVWNCLSVSGDGTTGLIANTNNNNEFFIGTKETWYSEATWAESAITSAARGLLDDTTQAAQQATLGLGTGDSLTFTGLTLSGLTASQFVLTSADKALASLAVPLTIPYGGTGLTTVTNHGLLLGSGTGAITPLAEATNGQIPIGSTGADPVLAALTAGDGIDITNAAGSITVVSTISQFTDELAQDAVGGILDDGTVGNIVFTYNDAGGVISAVTQDGEIDHDSLLNVHQDVNTDASPTFAGLTVTGNSVLGLNSAVFQPTADSTTFFQVKNAAGTTYPFIVDTVNDTIGIDALAASGTKINVGIATGETLLAFDDYTFEYESSNVDHYNLGVSTTVADKLYIRNAQGSSEQAWLFGDGGTGGTIFGVAGSTDNGVNWNCGIAVSVEGRTGMGKAPLLTGPTLQVYTNTQAYPLAVYSSVFAAGPTPGFVAYSSRGTVDSPTATQSADYLLNFAGRGYDGSDYTSPSPSLITFKAAEDFSATNQGTNMSLYTTPIGSTGASAALRLFVADTGFVGLGGEADPETLLELTHATPYITLHNSTHEDADGGRESIIYGKGEKSGGEEGTLGGITIAHDDTSDDYKGKIVLSTNANGGADTLVDALTIDSAQNVIVGDGTNQAIISHTGVLTLEGTARVWKADNLNPTRVKLAGVNPPAEDVIDYFAFHRYDKATEESVFFMWTVPNDFATGTASVRGNYVFVVDHPPAAGGNLNVRMGFEYKKLSEEDVFSFTSGTTSGYIDEAIVEGETAFALHITDNGVCDTTGWAPRDRILFRFFRKAADAADTYDDDGPAENDVWIKNYHLEYLVNRLGEAS